MDAHDVRDATILIVDDQQANIDLLEAFLSEGPYPNLHSTTDPRLAAALFAKHRPDLVLLDLHMPHADGFAVMSELRRLTPPGEFLPVLVLTADVNPEVKRRALAGGATDFLAKPLDETEVLLRIRNLLETRRLQRMSVAEAARRAEGERLVALERVRAHIATDLHDDIAASLSRIALMSEVVRRRVETGADADGTLGALAEIGESARELVDSMRDIVWSIDPRRDDLRSLVQRVRKFASDVLGAKGIRWEFGVQSGAEELPLLPEQRRQLFLIFKEAVNNVARHSGCRTAALSIGVEGGLLRASVRDDGKGFARPTPGEEAASGGNGLASMQERAARAGGSLVVETRPGAGTLLELTLPLGR